MTKFFGWVLLFFDDHSFFATAHGRLKTSEGIAPVSPVDFKRGVVLP